ncbi:MAG TPA: hypothetical protein VK663_01120 [Burkholderiales bacterium]|nr:hypothetical protein [Burkholderiales bacterium]
MPFAWAAAIGAVASVASGSMGASAAGSAADAQSASAAQATAEQRRQYDLSRADQAPFLNTGTAANVRLRQLLGLGGPSTSNAAELGTMQLPNGSSVLQEAERRSDATAVPAGNVPLSWYRTNDPTFYNQTLQKYVPQILQDFNINPATSGGQAGGQAGGEDGSLLRNFSSADLAADPVYNSGLQFGLDQGAAGINSRAIAQGGYDSGATLKALTRFGNDYGSTKANESYNRFNQNQTNIYNKLAGVSGTGQVAAGQVQQAGSNAANNISELDTQAGNARAAGIVGGANAWGGALGGVTSAANSYNNNQILQQLLKRNGTSGGSSYSGALNGVSGYYDPSSGDFG